MLAICSELQTRAVDHESRQASDDAGRKVAPARSVSIEFTHAQHPALAEIEKKRLLHVEQGSPKMLPAKTAQVLTTGERIEIDPFVGVCVTAIEDPGHPLAVKLLAFADRRSEEHTSELQSLRHLVCRL